MNDEYPLIIIKRMDVSYTRKEKPNEEILIIGYYVMCFWLKIRRRKMRQPFPVPDRNKIYSRKYDLNLEKGLIEVILLLNKKRRDLI